MVQFTKDDVLRLAYLARISLTDGEAEEFAPELQAILEYVRQLEAVDTDGLEPTSQVTGLVNVMRADEERSYGYDARSLLENVPRTADDCIQVDRMVG